MSLWRCWICAQPHWERGKLAPAADDPARLCAHREPEINLWLAETRLRAEELRRAASLDALRIAPQSAGVGETKQVRLVKRA